MKADELADKFGLHAKRFHIAVMREPFLTYILEGKKTVESRFSLHRIAPYQRVEIGDIVLLKAGMIVGHFTVAWVKCFDLREYPIEMIQQQFGEAICGDAEFWRAKHTKRYATLIGISRLHKLKPLSIEKHDRRAWVALQT